MPKNQIDHINHDRTDNKIKNLRDISHKNNGRNQSLDKRNKSGFTGVHWHKLFEKWQSTIRVNGKCIHLGYFTDKSKAIEIRKAANIKYGFHNNHGVLK